MQILTGSANSEGPRIGFLEPLCCYGTGIYDCIYAAADMASTTKKIDIGTSAWSVEKRSIAQCGAQQPKTVDILITFRILQQEH